MRDRVDDGSEMNIRRGSEALSEADADALLSGRALAGNEDLHEVVALMRTASTVPAPTPKTTLAAMLENGLAPLPVGSPQSPSRLASWSVRVAVATAAAMTATFGAATVNALPAPVQNAVADVVGSLTPLQLPRRPELRGTGSETDQDPAEPADVRFPRPGTDLSPGPEDETPGAPDTAPPARTSDDSDVPDDATDTDEPDVDDTESDTDEPESDEPDDATDVEEPDVGGPEADEPEADIQGRDEAETDEPEQSDSGDIDQGDVDDRELLDSDEPELDTDERDSDD